jgi:hypothetical protein
LGVDDVLAVDRRVQEWIDVIIRSGERHHETVQPTPSPAATPPATSASELGSRAPGSGRLGQRDDGEGRRAG